MPLAGSFPRDHMSYHVSSVWCFAAFSGCRRRRCLAHGCWDECRWRWFRSLLVESELICIIWNNRWHSPSSSARRAICVQQCPAVAHAMGISNITDKVGTVEPKRIPVESFVCMGIHPSAGLPLWCLLWLISCSSVCFLRSEFIVRRDKDGTQ